MTTTLRSIAVTVMMTILCLSVAPALAAPVTIEFEGITTQNPFTGPLTEDGFIYDLFPGSGGLFGDLNDGDPGPAIEGTSAVGGGILRIVSATMGEQYNFLGLDLAEEDSGNLSTNEITVEGFLNNVSVGVEMFTPLQAGGGHTRSLQYGYGKRLVRNDNRRPTDYAPCDIRLCPRASR